MTHTETLPDGTQVTIFEPDGDQESKFYEFTDGTKLWSGNIPDDQLYQDAPTIWGVIKEWLGL